MELKIKNAVLQDMVNKAIKGAGNDKVMPITELMGVEVVGQDLYLTTTNGDNFLTVYDKVEAADGDFAACIRADVFAKLITKTTAEFVHLKFENNVLTVKGNGTHNIPAATDEDGELVQIEQAGIPAGAAVTEYTAKAKDLKDAFAIGKTALATNNSTECFTGFYFYENGTVTSDGGKAAFTKKQIFKSPVLLRSSFMNLVPLFGGEDVKVVETENNVLLHAPGVKAVGNKMAQVAEFPIESIVQFTEVEFPHTVKLNKTALLNVLDRVALFIGQYDRNGVRFNFGPKGVLITDLKASSSELLKAEGDLKEFSFVLDVNSFKDMLSVNTDEAVKLSYGNEQAVKIEFDDTVQVLATQIEEEEAK